jgi:membrane-associated protease RseP (regulator of RpoE activity)
MRWVLVAAVAILFVLQTASYHTFGGFVGVTLGSTPEAALDTDPYRRSGVRVVGLVPGGGAARARLEPGDIIVEVEGVKITEPPDLRAVLEGCSPGDDIRLTVWRDGTAVGVAATLCARGGTGQRCRRSRESSCEPWLGVRVEPIDESAAGGLGVAHAVLPSESGGHDATRGGGARSRNTRATGDGEVGPLSLACGALVQGLGHW